MRSFPLENSVETWYCRATEKKLYTIFKIQKREREDSTMHAIEKILAKNSGRAEVHTGEIVTAKVDFAEINDLYLQTVYSFYEMGGEKVWNRERAAFVFDHYAPCPDIKSAANHKEMREFAKKNDLRFHFDTNCGVCHQVMPEAGVI